MSLTKSDLKQIKSIVKEMLSESREQLLSIIFRYFPTKEEIRAEMASKVDLKEIKLDISNLKDDVATIRTELDTEHEFRLQQIELNKAEIIRIKQHINLS